MKIEVIARCSSCQKAHQIVSRAPKKVQSVNFMCRCGNKIGGMYDTKQWEFTNAVLTERNENEPVFMHEPELQ